MLTQDEVTHFENEIFPILHYLHENGEFDSVVSNIKSKLDTMEQEQKQLSPLLEVLEGILIAELPILIEKGEAAIAGLFHKHSAEIGGVVKTLEITRCPAGYTRDSNGVCQKDPLPPDPTHQ